MSPPDDEGALWYDDEAGPLVRAYTITGGRTRPATGQDIDLIAVIVADPDAEPDDALDDQHLALMDLCRRAPISVAELASEADLAIGVVRVLLGDLLQDGRLRVIRPVPPADLPDVGLLRDVINGLRAL
ncbi:DUF742 domain-containing protein [Actinacidiphila soli]|jgi:hypothetical protein|uniref:DUF742 domain-containing protein n=1 Tax=Actinacidiphila soli TaxID=2487275 RepID=UPI000FCA3EA7|nr:DUF742 domain-containing protein [Actinacidiphila soli]